MIIIKTRFLTTGEVWFNDEPTNEKVDVLVFRQRPSPVSGTRCSSFYTILIDVTKSTDDLFASFSKETRYEIRCAETKDSFICLHWFENNQNVLRQFISFYNRFAETKGLSAINERWLIALVNANALALSCCCTSDNEDLVWHAYYRCPERVRLLYSASLYREAATGAYRSMVGRAKRFLHWKDILKQLSI